MYNSSKIDGRTMIRLGPGAPRQDNNKAAPICCVPIQTTATLNIQLFPVHGGHRRPTAVAPSTAAAATTSRPTSSSASTQYYSDESSSAAATAAATASSPIVVQSNSFRSTQTDSDDCSNWRHHQSTNTSYTTDADSCLSTVSRSSSCSNSSTGQRSPTAKATTTIVTSAETTLADSSFASPPSPPASCLPTSSIGSSGNSRSNSSSGDVVIITGNTVDTMTSRVDLDDRSSSTSAAAADDDDHRVAAKTSRSSSSSSSLSRGVSGSGSVGRSTVSTGEPAVNVGCESTTMQQQQQQQSSVPMSDQGHSVWTVTASACSDVGSVAVASAADERSTGIGGSGVDRSDRDVRSASPAADYDDEDDEDENAALSTFSFLGWDIMSEMKPASQGCRRVLVFKDPYVVLMFKACCATEKVGNDPRLLSLMADIAENCAKRLRLLRNITLPQLSAEHMDSLPLNDGRKTGDHLADISRDLGEKVTITDMAYRFQPDDTESHIYIGTYVQGTIFTGRQLSIGTSGVIAVLTKKNKFATVEAFSEQLCQHIARSRPSGLGSFDGDRRAGRASQWRRRAPQADRQQLMVQSFTFDPTIIVAEAARRCFVTIENYLLFG